MKPPVCDINWPAIEDKERMCASFREYGKYWKKNVILRYVPSGRFTKGSKSVSAKLRAAQRRAVREHGQRNAAQWVDERRFMASDLTADISSKHANEELCRGRNTGSHTELAQTGTKNVNVDPEPFFLLWMCCHC